MLKTKKHGEVSCKALAYCLEGGEDNTAIEIFDEVMKDIAIEHLSKTYPEEQAKEMWDKIYSLEDPFTFDIILMLIQTDMLDNTENCLDCVSNLIDAALKMDIKKIA